MVLVEIVSGTAIGLFLAYFVPKLLMAVKRRTIRSKARKKILKQDMDYVLDGKRYDLEKAMAGMDPYSYPVMKEVKELKEAVLKSTPRTKLKKVKKIGRKPKKNKKV